MLQQNKYDYRFICTNFFSSCIHATKNEKEKKIKQYKSFAKEQINK